MTDEIQPSIDGTKTGGLRESGHMDDVAIDTQKGTASTDFGDVLLTRKTIAYYNALPRKGGTLDIGADAVRLWLEYLEIVVDFAEEEFTFEHGTCDPVPCITDWIEKQAV